jgi:hypothetical protein
LWRLIPRGLGRGAGELRGRVDGGTAHDYVPENNDFYYLHRIPKDLFVPIFAVGRVPGWTVQVLAQQANNILIRPLTLYSGPAPRDYLPIDRRG